MVYVGATTGNDRFAGRELPTKLAMLDHSPNEVLNDCAHRHEGQGHAG